LAALNYLEGKLITRTERKHTHVEWLRFLKQIDRETPKELAIHVIADNYATHKHAKVKKWLGTHKRFQMHFTPTSSSWMNLVERFFGELTNDCIREGSFQSVRELIRAIEEYLVGETKSPSDTCGEPKARRFSARSRAQGSASQQLLLANYVTLH
jgi:transposase